MTETHKKNVDTMIDLVEREIAAMVAGELELLQEILPEKEAMAAVLEADGAALGAAISNPDEAGQELRASLSHLQNLIEKDQRMLGQVSRSMREIAAELFGDPERERLRGLYNSKGRKAPNLPLPAPKFDQSL